MSLENRWPILEIYIDAFIINSTKDWDVTKIPTEFETITKWD
jgi:hypothetical protein